MRPMLIVGGLTIDRFADGTTAPGGSVLHAGLAVATAGLRPTFLTVAGPEPEASDGLGRLAALGDLRHVDAPATTRFGHGEVDGRRVLHYEVAGGSITMPSSDLAPADLLAAPIADELSPAAVAELRERLRPACTTLLIQGWLRRLAVGQPVHPLRLDEVPEPTWACFASADAIVVSTEDLAETHEDPFEQAAALRSRIGPAPVLVLTLGTEGYLLDDPRADRVVAAVPRRIIAGVPTVGAGDTFGAVLTMELARGTSPDLAAAAATNAVIDLLERRAGSSES